MPFLAVASVGAAVAKKAGIHISLKKGSPRYQGGPLISTVNGFLTRIAAGDQNAIRELNTIRTNPGEKHRKAWSAVWDVEVPKQPLTPAQIALITQLDASKAGITGSAAPSLAIGSVSALQEAAEPLREAAADSVAQLREAAASTIERVGVGGGAAGARAIRGDAGPLDRLITFAKDPTGAIVLAIGAVALVIGVTFVFARRGR